MLRDAQSLLHVMLHAGTWLSPSHLPSLSQHAFYENICCFAWCLNTPPSWKACSLPFQVWEDELVKPGGGKQLPKMQLLLRFSQPLYLDPGLLLEL